MSIATCCSEMFCEVLQSVLPDRTKRLLLLTSLCPKVIGKEDLTHEYLALLNSQLSLSREEDALRLPIAISNYIWPQIDDVVSEETLANSDNVDSLTAKILGKIPEWLKYDRDQVMTSEIGMFLKFNSVFQRSHHHGQLAH